MKSSVIDNDYHPDDKLDNDADPDHWGTQLAGDVVQGPTGGSGMDHKAAGYAVGSQKDPKVIPISPDALRAWYGRTQKARQ